MNMALQIERALANEKVHQRDTMPFEITPTVREALHWATLGAAQVLGMGKRDRPRWWPGKKRTSLLSATEMVLWHRCTPQAVWCR